MEDVAQKIRIAVPPGGYARLVQPEEPVMTTIITAAGGNATAIDTLAAPLTRAAYAARGQALVAAYAAQGVEQAGFLIRTANAAHFEMAGGEFCGNAARAAALLLAPQGGAVSFSMSGFAGRVQAEVVRRAADFWVRCRFPGMQAVARAVRLDDGSAAALVDLGGIVHVVLEAAFPAAAEAFRARHRALCVQLDLAARSAVGVVWCERAHGRVAIHPVVWVREVDSFFYESSCGSGSIAAAAVCGVGSVRQPSGREMDVTLDGAGIALASEMAVLDGVRVS